MLGKGIEAKEKLTMYLHKRYKYLISKQETPYTRSFNVDKSIIRNLMPELSEKEFERFITSIYEEKIIVKDDAHTVRFNTDFIHSLPLPKYFD